MAIRKIKGDKVAENATQNVSTAYMAELGVQSGVLNGVAGVRPYTQQCVEWKFVAAYVNEYRNDTKSKFKGWPWLAKEVDRNPSLPVPPPTLAPGNAVEEQVIVMRSWDSNE